MDSGRGVRFTVASGSTELIINEDATRELAGKLYLYTDPNGGAPHYHVEIKGRTRSQDKMFSMPKDGDCLFHAINFLENYNTITKTSSDYEISAQADDNGVYEVTGKSTARSTIQNMRNQVYSWVKNHVNLIGSEIESNMDSGDSGLRAGGIFTEPASNLMATETLDAGQWAEEWLDSMQRVYDDYGLQGRWIPIIATGQDDDKGNYWFQVVNYDNPDENHWLAVNNKTIARFKTFLDSDMSRLVNNYEFTDGQLKAIDRNGVDEEVISADAPDGMNTAFGLMAMMSWLQKREDIGDEKYYMAHQLRKALEIKLASQ